MFAIIFSSGSLEILISIILSVLSIFITSATDFLAISKSLAKTKKYQKLSKKYPTMIWTIESDDDTSCDDFIYICNIRPKKN